MLAKLSKPFLTLLIITFLFSINGVCAGKVSPKKIYVSFILHGNMNYDRYVRPTIWRDFPVIYNNLLNFMDEHPDFKGQLQFSGQTFKSLQQAAPNVIEHAIKLNKSGKLNFTGTFYSEPVNINMDGETNFRCANLGTSIIADAIGSTDGFYLQERAFHPQLPWILNHSGVSWVPVVTGDNTYSPFKLKGMDGSVTICVPTILRYDIFDKLKEAPENSLFVVEDDYEIPQGFVDMYREIDSFNKENKDYKIEWITVKEYIGKYGVKAEKYVDHSAKARNMDNGTYSRWTSDPQDIIIQNYTNHAMSDFRTATIVNSLTRFLLHENIDVPFNESRITLKPDPVIWNIEHASTYPDIEPKFLSRNGQVTILTKAEHLLLWSVNSDARGWYPLSERRRERINSFENSSALSTEIINRGLALISQNIKVEGYDRYFIAFNAEPERNKVVTIETDYPYEVFDYAKGEKLKSTVIETEGKYKIEFESEFPAYGYSVIGLKKSKDVGVYPWNNGTSVENGKLKLSAEEDKIILTRNGSKIEISLDSFKIKALAEMTDGRGDDVWRKAVPYGNSRISVRNTLFPQLRIEKQIDWLIHMQQTFTLLPDRVLCNIDFTFLHPTLVRKDGATKENTFNPQGLTLQFNSGRPGKVFYDIPFGISPNSLTGLSYYCPLSSSIFQFDAGGGFMLTASTGEQAFYTNTEKGEVGSYMGASTTSGPIRNVGMKFISQTEIEHEPAWYSEPFQGTYNHQFMLYPFDGSWQENNAPVVSKNYTEKIYLREFYPAKNSGELSAEKNLISVSQPGIEITSIEPVVNGLRVRLNDKLNRDSDVAIKIGDKTKMVHIQANGIVDVEF